MCCVFSPPILPVRRLQASVVVYAWLCRVDAAPLARCTGKTRCSFGRAGHNGERAFVERVLLAYASQARASRCVIDRSVPRKQQKLDVVFHESVEESFCMLQHVVVALRHGFTFFLYPPVLGI